MNVYWIILVIVICIGVIYGGKEVKTDNVELNNNNNNNNNNNKYDPKLDEIHYNSFNDQKDDDFDEQNEKNIDYNDQYFTKSIYDKEEEEYYYFYDEDVDATDDYEDYDYYD